jgi:hypothetical protein
MENNLKIARRDYKLGTRFLSATNNLNAPLRVSSLFEAIHEDRITEIKETTNKERRKYLQSLENDIVNSEGGVIYCGETKRWAKKV